MFFLSLIEHKFRVPVTSLKLPLNEGIKCELERVFLDKVIPELGLCISVYDIRSINGGFIAPSEGAPTYTVKFRLIMFRPILGEIITAKVKEMGSTGLKLSLGFFDDIYVPAHLMPNPSRFESKPDNVNYHTWIWEYEGKEFIIDGAEEIRFRVHTVKFPPLPLEQPKDSKPFAPMVINGSLDDDGLGPISWWIENEEEEEEES